MKRSIALAFLLIVPVSMSAMTPSLDGAPPDYDPTPPASPWGHDDGAGNTNLMTPAKALAAKDRIRTGDTFVLAHDSENGMPIAPGNSWVQSAKPPLFVNKQLANGESFTSEFTQAGTQFDALCHFGFIPSGTTPHDAVYYNQYTHFEVAGTHGLHKCGVEQLRPFATKAVFLDVSRHLFANGIMPEGTGITVAMALHTLAAQGMSASDIEPGDVVIFRTGWERNWKITPGSVESTLGYYKGFPGVPGGVPGLTLELAIWLADKHVAGVGADNWGVDVMPAVDAPTGVSLPVHNHLLTRGIPMFESLKIEALADHLAALAAGEDDDDDEDENVYEVAFFFAPVRIKGGSGSPASVLVVT